MTGPVLLCTVGGSPEPIVSALRALRPRRVLFLVTEDRPDLAQKGSADQVPGILAAAGDLPEEHSLQVVPPDDPDAVFAAASVLLDDLAGCKVVADYTGGTKSMSAGLLQAALGREHVCVQLMAGERSTTDQVRAGTERPFPLRFDTLLATRDLERAAAFWRDFAYGAATAVLAPWLTVDEGRSGDLPAGLAARLRRVHALSRALDAWDRFDHVGALALLAPQAAEGSVYASLLPALRRLAANAGRVVSSGRRERWLPPEDPLLPLDLWRNAERRAIGGRYDDAVARCYRLTEASVQWVLWTERGIDTGAVDPSKVKPRTAASCTTRGELALVKALDALGDELGRQHAFYALMQRQLDGRSARLRLEDWIRCRNDSVLAHGFRPVTTSDWQVVSTWCRRSLIPWLEGRAREQGLHLPQLPTAP